MLKKDISFRKNNKYIYNILYCPDDMTKRVPVAVFSHEFGFTGDRGSVYAACLAKHGIACCCPDFCGGSAHSRSSGDTTAMSVHTEEEDLSDVVDFVKNQEYTDTKNIFLIGASQGGVASAFYASEHSDDIRGMVLLYPAFSIPDYLKAIYSNESDVPETDSVMGVHVGRIYFTDMMNYDVYSNISGYKKDILILHGDKDELVDISYSKRAVHVYKSAELVVIPGAGHGFNDNEKKQACKSMLAYIERQII